MPKSAGASVFHPRAFRGRVYGVTGGAHGIGEAAVRQLVALGARVALLDINKAELARVAADLRAHGDALLPLRGDVADERFMARSIRAAHRRWGRIDGWVNNAMDNPFRVLERETPETFARSWRVNTQAAWFACQLLAPLMRKTGGGSIVNMSSILVHNGYRANAAYISSKAALEGLTRALAIELAPDRIRVNAVVPGAIQTAWGNLSALSGRRFEGVDPDDARKFLEVREKFRRHQSLLLQPWPDRGQPDQAAGVILFLLSAAASFVTGACVAVDGGATVAQPVAMAMPLAEMAADQAMIQELVEKYEHLRPWHLPKRSDPARPPLGAPVPAGSVAAVDAAGAGRG